MTFRVRDDVGDISELVDDTPTGIMVRALQGEKWVSADIAFLDDDSLWRWLHSAPGVAARTVFLLFGREPHG